MNIYEFTYITEHYRPSLTKQVEAIGLAEAVDIFIETYCPVGVIQSVVMVVNPPKLQNRESRKA